MQHKEHSQVGKTNRLVDEQSPYLLQHARNPVDWFPWGTEAFEKARLENKLIFLSIGYSTCHWCHVMERESFEDSEVAALLKADYISIKVDREERPDIDHVYMNAIQAMTGSGGWPLTVFMTPNAQPITGGTYFPPEDKWGRQGLKSILPRLAELWKTEPEKMKAAGDEMTQLLQSTPKQGFNEFNPESLFLHALRQFKSSFDEVYGGFGGAPKFPRSHDLSFLLRMWRRSSDKDALRMVEKTLKMMAHGGIYDHLGGGFSRYSTDEMWLVPHFEKMLYDQAILARTYLEAYQATRNPLYAETARDILNYVLRDMTSPDGGFYSAEDADSEGVEGKFYVWSSDEIREILKNENVTLFLEFYGVSPQGNFEGGVSILHRRGTEEEFAASKGLEVEVFKKSLAQMRRQLFEVRKHRIPPYKDDKILTAWNGMMISAFAYAGQVLDEPLYCLTAKRGADFVLKRLQGNGRLLRRCREDKSAILGFQDDYSFFANSLVDLYEATFEIGYLEEACRLTEEMLRLFWDSENHGFFYTGTDAEPLIARVKEYYDGAVPSGNSTAALLMLRLLRITGNKFFEKKIFELIASNGAALAQHPVAHAYLLCVLDFMQGPSREIVLAGEEKSPEFLKLKKTIWKNYDPNRVVLHHPLGGDAIRIEKIADFIRNQNPVGGQPCVYVCSGNTCLQPTVQADQLEQILGKV